ncbi:MAG: Efflux ABC transporter, ATP-binding protein [uncultured Acidimicrobiales bacterium]|uniref:Efflux ABC transporter, ATP-binding protein n=1 Tax=uncultured Acidimicrobiales bacterium TaxID=310071 RepID=A0A6J4I4Z8_9ACTN|nr:MAG: Efflux ABC transporter, ATP-binding protein [uncultured Acidimicrobiales bacterium]
MTSAEEAAGDVRGDGGPLPISATGLRKAYRNRTVLDDVDLHVGPGQVVGLLGPNGAGKTTIVKSLLGMVHLDGGTATVLGRPAGDPAARRAVGYLPEQFQYPAWLDGRQVLEVHARLIGLPAALRPGALADALRLVGLAGRGGDRVGGYSKGMQQRLGLATAVLGRPALVILDEPTSALDPIGRREVRDLIRSLRDRGTAVLLNSHLLGEVEQVCDHVVILDRGRVVSSGALADVAVGAEVRVTLERLDNAAHAILEGFGRVAAVDGDTALVVLDDVAAVPALASALVSQGHGLQALVPLQRSLEDVFVDLVGASAEGEGR